MRFAEEEWREGEEKVTMNERPETCASRAEPSLDEPKAATPFHLTCSGRNLMASAASHAATPARLSKNDRWPARWNASRRDWLTLRAAEVRLAIEILGVSDGAQVLLDAARLVRLLPARPPAGEARCRPD